MFHDVRIEYLVDFIFLYKELTYLYISISRFILAISKFYYLASTLEMSKSDA